MKLSNLWQDSQINQLICQGSNKSWDSFSVTDSNRVISSTSGKQLQVEEINLTLTISKSFMIIFGQVNSNV